MQDNPVEVLADAFVGTGPWHVGYFGFGYHRLWYTVLESPIPSRDGVGKLVPLAIYMPLGSKLLLTKGKFALHQGEAATTDQKIAPGFFTLTRPAELVPKSARCVVIVPDRNMCQAVREDDSPPPDPGPTTYSTRRPWLS